MKNNIIKTVLPAAVVGLVFSACTKMEDIGTMNTGSYTDTTGTLKSATTMPIGFAAYQGDPGFNSYWPIIVAEGTNITPGNEMKHGSIVTSSGAMDYTKADALVNKAQAAGLDVYGHTLAWHSQQNATYIKSYAGITVPAAAELITNPGFEATPAGSGWATYNAQNGATVTYPTTGGTNAHAGAGFMQVVNPVSNPGGEWKVQVASTAFPTVIGKQYVVTYWVKAATGGGSIRLSTSGTPMYQGGQTIGTTWQQITWNITANVTSTSILFDMGLVANTYNIDDVSVKEVITPPSGAQVAVKVDELMNSFITGMVTRYKGKVKAWDVVNEPLIDNGSLRSVSNYGSTPGNDVFFWQDYSYNGVPKDYAVKAFQYAAAADPAAKLFINDYNLESSKAKIDSLVAYVTYLKGKGAKIDGIGTQMHCDVFKTNYGGIDYMFQKLAATGLLVKVTELDITIKGSVSDATVADAQVAGYQAAMYNYIVAAYMKYVPAAQRAGITFWGVDDPDSWRASQLPVMWDKNFKKKPAYSGAANALKANK
ncbi:MAG TPA: endo-1,4-beta-xylanase [Phnomibacter sp.]|nr:endo-1,4-beta-xylanase [Phnomibacter sp.]